MVKLLQFLYRAFDFDDLWLSYDDYRSKTIESQGLDLVTTAHAIITPSDGCKNGDPSVMITPSEQSAMAQQLNTNLSLNPQIINNNNHIISSIKSQQFDDRMKSKYLKSYLMTRCQFGRLLKRKCKLFLKILKNKNDNDNVKNKKGLFMVCAIELLLEYPLNDKYGLLKPVIYDKQHPLNKYHNKKYVDNFDKNANQDIDSLNIHQTHNNQLNDINDESIPPQLPFITNNHNTYLSI